ncbi:MAG: hypothetical protein RIS47_866, partial [Bacteroidota bacterium]
MITNAGQSNISNSGINYRPALIILTFLFFIWGGITSLNDVLIPHLKDIFELNYFTAMLVQFAFFAAYFVMGYPAGWVVGRIGYKKGLVLGLGITGLGAAMFYPAAEFQVFALFLIGFFTLASGITVLQTAANPYVAILGTPDSASARLNLSQAFASLGTIIFPIVGAFFILQSSLNLSPEQKAELVQVPYLGIALALVLMAVVLAFSKLPKIGDRSKEDLSGTDDSVSAWRFTHLVLGAIALFFYAGAEVSIGSFFINYMGADGLNTLPKSADAGKFLALYWGGAMVGRFLGAILLKKSNAWSKIFGVLLVYLLGFFLAVMTTQGIGGFFEAIGRFNLVALGKWFELGLPAAITFMALVVVNTLAFLLGNKKPHVTLAVFAAIAIGLLTLSMTNNDNLVFYGTSINLAMWAVVGLGLFNSVMFPNIFTLGLRDLGKSTGQGSGILVMALVGGAVLPLLMGLMADSFSLRLAFVVPLVGYVYILYYGIDGYRLRQQTVSVGITDAAIGIDIGSNTTKIGIADKNGNVLEKAEFQTNNFPSPEELVVGIHRAIEELLQKTDHAVDIKGVGVAVSGGNFYNGTIDNPINLPYEG